MSMQVDSGYLLATIHDPSDLQEKFSAELSEIDLLGTLIVAPEGLNWSLCGTPDALDAYAGLLPRFNVEGLIRNIRTPAHPASEEKAPFERLKLRVQPELITSGLDPNTLPGADGTHVAPESFNALLDQPGMRLIDVRNQYEVEIGTFEQAENPHTQGFVEFAQFIDQALKSADRDTPIALCCTGGIRCERASQLLLKKGFQHIYQLAGGILAYLSAVPPSEQRFIGECFVFDGRVSLTADLEVGNYELDGAHVVHAGQAIEARVRAPPTQCP